LGQNGTIAGGWRGIACVFGSCRNSRKRKGELEQRWSGGFFASENESGKKQTKNGKISEFNGKNRDFSALL
jgi:hypothetical protein